MKGLRETESAFTTPVSMFAPIALFTTLAPEWVIKCEIKPEVVVFPFVPVILIFVEIYLLQSCRKFGQSLRTIRPIIDVPEDSFVTLSVVYADFATARDK